MENIKRPGIFEVNLIYLVLGLALLILGTIVQSKEVYSGLLITEYIIILLPNILYLVLKGFSLKQVLRLNKITFKQLLYIFLIVIFSYPIAVFLNMIVISILSNFTTVMPTTVPLPTSLKEFVLGVFVIAVAPGICEEVMFRGTMMKAYDRLGTRNSIIITALLFGMFHFNIMNFVGPAFLGIILGVLVHKTNSILSSIFAHTLNNGIALSIGFALNQFASKLDNLVDTNMVLPESTQLLISIIFFGVVALISLGILVLLIKNIPSNPGTTHTPEYTTSIKTEGYRNVKYAPIFVILITFIILNIRFLFFTV